MNKERKILLIILIAIIFVVLLVMLFSNIRTVSKNSLIIKDYTKKLSVSSPSMQYFLSLEKIESELMKNIDEKSSYYFADNHISFYQFCNLFLEAARKENLEIENYQTNSQQENPQLIIIAKGRILNCLNYLHYLNEYPNALSIPNLSIKHNQQDNLYDINIRITYYNKEKE